MESAPNAALVHTLAIGKDGRAADAYGEESRFIADRMAEAESVSARKATLLDPTGEDETIQVLRRTPPCAGYVARTILMHPFAFNDPLKGLSPELNRPGVGQQQVVRTLRDLGKLRLPEDEPDSPAPRAERRGKPFPRPRSRRAGRHRERNARPSPPKACSRRR